MLVSLELLIVGRSREMVEELTQQLDEPQQILTLTPYVAPSNNLPDEALYPLPDAILCCVNTDWREGVWELIEAIPNPRPPLFIITPNNDMDFLRMAMRLGVRDVFTLPLQAEETANAIARLVREERARRGAAGSRLISFMNTKGGSGASLIAANVAIAMALRARGDPRLLLMDFDFQFGGLPTYLDLKVRDGLIKALQFVEALDEVALRAYIQRHDTQVHLLAAAMDEIIIPEDVSPARVEAMLEAINGIYSNILVDLPHRIDAAIAAILQRSDVIALATQQTIAHLHETKRLIFLLHKRLNIDSERLLLVINRYDRRAELGLKEFRDVFPTLAIQTLPNDYVRASESINLGEPVCEKAPKSPLGIGLMKLAEVLTSKTLISDEEPIEPQQRGWLSLLKRQPT
ncbi:MAG: AAA family ATPase [Lamprobacter sp.]|uniref:AAA family ATPase n=1 Tax=Lamprobacter sp. TaxID=3100796 RepID=UPI002B260B4D|nr:AAA family ATPase [Lamprobacter sp.]MEA3640843.1 AAA family ATPase [Lamprobacter sp.]